MFSSVSIPYLKFNNVQTSGIKLNICIRQKCFQLFIEYEIAESGQYSHIIECEYEICLIPSKKNTNGSSLYVGLSKYHVITLMNTCYTHMVTINVLLKHRKEIANNKTGTQTTKFFVLKSYLAADEWFSVVPCGWTFCRGGGGLESAVKLYVLTIAMLLADKDALVRIRTSLLWTTVSDAGVDDKAMEDLLRFSFICFAGILKSQPQKHSDKYLITNSSQKHLCSCVEIFIHIWEITKFTLSMETFVLPTYIRLVNIMLLLLGKLILLLIYYTVYDL